MDENRVMRLRRLLFVTSVAREREMGTGKESCPFRYRLRAFFCNERSLLGLELVCEAASIREWRIPRGWLHQSSHIVVVVV